MQCRLMIVSSLVIIIHVLTSCSVRIQHPSLWLKSQGTLLLTANQQQKPNRNYIARAHRTKAYKKCLLIQNIDGSTLRFKEEENSFGLTSNLTATSTDLNSQMFILTLNLQAVEDQDQQVMQTIRRYIHEDNPNGRNFILVRAVYWPFYLCSNSDSVVYGSEIKNDTLSHDCIWYRIISSSGYMNLIKLDQMPFYNVTYQRSQALASYPRNHLKLLPYNELLDKSLFWALALSQQSIPRHRYQRSVVLRVNNPISPKLKWIFDNSNDLKKTILPAICFELDKKIQVQLHFKRNISQRLTRIKEVIAAQSANVTATFDRFIDFLPAYHNYRIKIESYIKNQRFFKRHNLQRFHERNQVRILKTKKEFSSKLRQWNHVRYQLCDFLVKNRSCLCLTKSEELGWKCSQFDFHEYMLSMSSIWSKVPSAEDIMLFNIYRGRYEGSHSIIERRRAYFQSQQRYHSFHSNNYYTKVQICL